jgi:hypothetical protein
MATQPLVSPGETVMSRRTALHDSPGPRSTLSLRMYRSSPPRLACTITLRSGSNGHAFYVVREDLGPS